MTSNQVRDAAALIRLEYHEIPGLRLTFWQARRLFDLTEEICEPALDMLVQCGFLHVTATGTYQRRSAGDASMAAIEPLVSARSERPQTGAPGVRRKEG